MKVRTMVPAKAPTRARGLRQRGITMLGLVMWGIVAAFGALLVMKVFPTLNEYWTIKSAVDKIAKEGPTTVADVRKSFERQQIVDYSISSIGPKDLEVTKEGDKLVIRFAYDKEVALFEPVFLLIKYRGEGRAK